MSNVYMYKYIVHVVGWNGLDGIMLGNNCVRLKLFLRMRLMGKTNLLFFYTLSSRFVATLSIVKPKLYDLCNVISIFFMSLMTSSEKKYIYINLVHIYYIYYYIYV